MNTNDFNKVCKEINTAAYSSKLTWRRKIYYAFYDFCDDLIPYKIQDKWYAVQCWFNPRNRWATDVIPNKWADKTNLIPTLLFAAVIDFVDGEKALETIVWAKKDEKQILEVYHWAKTGRAEFQAKIDAAYPKSDFLFPHHREGGVDGGAKSYVELYGEVNRLEVEFEKIDTKHLTWIVKNRQLLWT